MKAKSQKLPTLGVVVPVFNEAGQLEKCLDKLLAQKSEINEIVLVDNNSTDGSLEIALGYAKKNKKIKVLQEKTQGLFATRNSGFKNVESDVIGRIDADTLVSPGWAKSIRECFAANPDAVALAGVTYYYDLPFYRLTSKIAEAVTGSMSKKSGASPKLYGPNMALRFDDAQEETKKSCGPGRLNEDLDITIHLRSSGQKTAFCTGMRAEVSGRRFLSAPPSYFRYCLQWPRTYRVHGLYGSALAAYTATLFICLAQTLLVLPLRAYNPKEKKFSLKHLASYNNTRPAP